MAEEQNKKQEAPQADAAVAEAPAPKAEKKEVQVSAKLGGIIKSVEEMTVMELADLVKALEDKFGVSAAMPVAAIAAGGTAAAGAAAEEEKTSFTVVLTGAGDKKINVIKEIRAVTTLGLKEAKDLVEAAPKTVKEGLPKEEAEKIKKQLEAAGAKVELK